MAKFSLNNLLKLLPSSFETFGAIHAPSSVSKYIFTCKFIHFLKTPSPHKGNLIKVSKKFLCASLRLLVQYMHHGEETRTL